MDGGILPDGAILRDCPRPYINFIIGPFWSIRPINLSKLQV